MPAPRQREPHACVLLLLCCRLAVRRGRSSACQERPPSATVRFLACIATVRGREQRSPAAAGQPEQSLLFLGAGAGRPGRTVGGGEEKRKAAAVPVLCFVSSVSVSVHFFSMAMFSSLKIQNLALCKKKIPHHIKLAVHAWSTKC